MQKKTDKVIYPGTYNDERQKAPVPPAIEEVTGKKDKAILNFQGLVLQGPVDAKYDGQKYCKIN